MQKSEAIGLVAISKCIAAKDEKAAAALIDEGANIGFELTAKVSGRLTRAKATTAAATASLLSKPVVAELLRRCGITRDAAMKHLMAIAEESLGTGGKVGDNLVDANPEILMMIHDLEKHIAAQLPPQPRAGSIKVVASPVAWRQLRIDGEDVKDLLSAA